MLSVVITAHNEGIEVEQTISSIFSRAVGPLEVIVIDDGSNDRSCEDLAQSPVKPGLVKVIRNHFRTGVAASRHQAVQVCQGDVLAFLDGHQRVGPGVLNRCSEVAVRESTIVVPDIRGFDPWDTSNHGAMFQLCPERGYFGAEWIDDLPQHVVTRITSLRAPAYLMSRETYDRVHWIQGLRNWGGSEAAISVKAFFLDIPILHLCGTPTLHMFKEKLEYNATWDDVWRNHALIARVCFDDRTWYKYWLPKLFEPHLTDEAKRDMESESIVAQHEEFQRVKVRTDVEFWTVLLKQPVPPELA